MEVISVASHKGGCGKTTSAVNLAGAANELGADILFIDFDSQGSATGHFGLEDATEGAGEWMGTQDPSLFDDVVLRARSMEESFLPNEENSSSVFHLLAGTMELGYVEQQLRGRPNRLLSRLEEIDDQYDLCIIDCGKGLDMLTFNGVHAGDVIVCPINCKRISLKGIREFHDLIDIARENGRDPDVYFLPTIYTRTRGEKRQGDTVIEVLEDVYGSYPEGQTLPPIRKWNGYDDAFIEGHTVFQSDRPNKGTEDYMRTLQLVSTSIGTELPPENVPSEVEV